MEQLDLTKYRHREIRANQLEEGMIVLPRYRKDDDGKVELNEHRRYEVLYVLKTWGWVTIDCNSIHWSMKDRGLKDYGEEEKLHVLEPIPDPTKRSLPLPAYLTPR